MWSIEAGDVRRARSVAIVEMGAVMGVLLARTQREEREPVPVARRRLTGVRPAPDAAGHASNPVPAPNRAEGAADFGAT